MTIRQRIILLIALVFAALAVVGGFAVTQARQSATRVKMVTEGVVPSAMQSAALLTQLKDVQIATLNMVGAPDPATIEQARTALVARKAELQTSLAAQLKTADSKAQTGLIKEAQESLENYFSSIDDTAKFMLTGKKELAEVNIASNVDQYLREQGEILRTLQVEKNRSKDEAISGLNPVASHRRCSFGPLCDRLHAVSPDRATSRRDGKKDDGDRDEPGFHAARTGYPCGRDRQVDDGIQRDG
jgi:two-component system chemotaxis sensor kinase CheA